MDRYRKFLFYVLIPACICVVSMRAAGATLHVPADYSTLQEAIDTASDGDTVLAADGVYSGAGNRGLHWNGAEKHLTVMSGNGPDAAIIDCSQADIAFRFNDSGQTTADTIAGFTIMHGAGDTCGAIYCERVGLTIRNCRFSQNAAIDDDWGMGGAIYFQNGILDVTSTVFENNSAGKKGGAVFAHQSEVRMTQVEFNGNTAASGGGAYLVDCPGNLSDSIVRNNVAAASGGGIFLLDAPLAVAAAVFSGNRALSGGALCCDGASFPVIGGSESAENRFFDNDAPNGADICALQQPETPIDARWNHFSYRPVSDYYVTPVEAFDLGDCSADSMAVQDDVYVSADGDDENDGLTPETPFRTLHHALSVVCGTASQPLSIFVGEGLFSPSATGEVFPLPILSHVSILGVGADRTQLDGENTVSGFQAMFDTGATLSDITLSHFSGSEGSALCERDSAIRVEGCVVSDNMASRGGGVYIRSGTSGYRNVTLTGNTAAREGSAMYCVESQAVFQDCTVSDNGSGNGAVALHKSEIAFTNTKIRGNDTCGVAGILSRDTFTNCEISGNAGNDYYSGGLQLFGCHLEVTDTVISGNASETLGGGVQAFLGGNRFTRCEFSGNSAKNGGGAGCGGGCETVFDRCLFRENTASDTGGAVYCEGDGEGNWTRLVNCVLTGNTGNAGGCALAGISGATVEIINCTLSGNTGNISSVGMADAALTLVNSIVRDAVPEQVSLESSSGDIMYCNLQGGWSGEGNIDADPLFVSGTDFHLRDGSPCIDAGTMDGAPGEDMDGASRPVGMTMEIGAYEYDGHPNESRLYVVMPSHFFQPGDTCGCTVMAWNTGEALENYPLFVVLNIAGAYFFAPGFTQETEWFTATFPPGASSLEVLPEFTWPRGAGTMRDVCWYAAVTLPDLSGLVMNLAEWHFGWE